MTTCVQRELKFEQEQRAERQRFAAFLAFHAANPQVYDEFRRRALLAKQSGRKRYSARTLIEAMRWDAEIVTVGGEFKLNDWFTPMLARLLAMREPQLFKGFFEFRTTKASIDDAELLRECNRIDACS